MSFAARSSELESSKTGWRRSWIPKCASGNRGEGVADMAVQGILSVTLQVPDLEAGVRFYTDAGLIGTSDGVTARFRCEAQNRDSLVLLGGAPAKRLHHIRLRADGIDDLLPRVRAQGGDIVPA